MGTLSDTQLFAWIEHLEHCPSCRARLGGLSPIDAMYQDVFDRALLRALAAVPCIAEERNTAPIDLAHLLKLPALARTLAVAAEPRFKTYSLASYILATSESTVSQNPRLALEMARLARFISTQIDPRTCGGTEALADLRAYALAMEGNAQRVCGDMAAALANFDRARNVQKRGSIDPDLIGRIDIAESSLRRDLRQTQDALTLLDRAAETFLSLEDHEHWLHTEINRANALIVQEEFDLACALLNEILPKANDPRLILFIRHNMASALASSGRHQEASRLLEESRELHIRFSNPLFASRRLWLEGLIACGLGEDRLATNLLNQAGTDLAERGYAFDAALARLDLRKLQARRRAEPVC